MPGDIGAIKRIGIEIDATRAVSGGRRAEGALRGVGQGATRAERDLQKFQRRQEAIQRTMDRLRSSVLGLGASFGAFLGIRSTVRFLSDLESAIVDVQKAADLDPRGIGDFRKELVSLSLQPGTGANAKELANLGAVAGTLGVRGSANLLKFSEVSAKLAASLRNIDSEFVAEGAGRILNITGEGAEGIERFGNVFARLEDTVAGGAQPILRAAKDVATATAQFDLSSTEVLGLAGGFTDLGVRAELARSVTTRSFLAIKDGIAEGGEELQILSSLTGIAADRLEQEFGNNAVDVFVRFIAGLKQVNDVGGRSSVVLKRLGLEGTEINAVLPTLAANWRIVARDIEAARIEGEQQVKLNEDAALKAGTFSAAVGRLGNTIDAVKDKLSGSQGGLEQFVRTSTQAIGLLFGIDEVSADAGEGARRLATGIKLSAAALTALVATKAVGFVGDLALGLGRLALNLGKISFGPLLAGAAAFGVAVAGIEFARFLIDEFRIVRETMIKFEATWELFWLGITNIPERAATSISKRFAGFATDQIADALGPGFGDKFKSLSDSIVNQQLDVDRISGEFSKRGAEIKRKRDEALSALNEEFRGPDGEQLSRKGGSFTDFLAKDLGAAITEIEKAGAALKTSLGGAIRNVEANIDGVTAGLAKTEAPSEKLTENVDKSGEFAKELDERLSAVFATLEKTRDLTKLELDNREELTDQAKELLELEEKRREVAEDRLREQRSELEGESREADALGRQVGRSVGTSIVDALQGGDVNGAIQSLNERIQSIALEQSVIKPIEEALGGLFSSSVDREIQAIDLQIQALNQNTTALGNLSTSIATGSTASLGGTGSLGGGSIGAGSLPATSGGTDSGIASLLSSSTATSNTYNASTIGNSGAAQFDQKFGLSGPTVGPSSGGFLNSIGGAGGVLSGLGGVVNIVGGARTDNNQQLGSGIGSIAGLALGAIIPGIGPILGPLIGQLLGGAIGGSFANGGVFDRGRVIPFGAGGAISGGLGGALVGVGQSALIGKGLEGKPQIARAVGGTGAGVASKAFADGGIVSGLVVGGLLSNVVGGLAGSAQGGGGGGGAKGFAAGGVVTAPTFFPMSGGQKGLMGEAGPEAIVPLANVGGKLGVRSAGGRVVNVTYNVVTPNADSFRRSQFHLSQDQQRAAERAL